ncbi:MAG: hypothetical protein HRU26_09180 [Psychroserpens sp.]|nr:hypothetical protein [Psychroserpens sp.]
MDKFKNHDHKYEIINLGTSHGANIEYGALKGRSFERAGNTLYYDLQNYIYIKDQLTEDAIVIIPVSYFSFGLDENRSDYEDPDAFVNDYYLYLPSSSIYNYSVKKHIQVYLNKVKENYLSVIDERFFHVPKEKSDSLEMDSILEMHAERRVPSHKKMAKYSEPQKNIEYLSDLVDEVESNGHKPVLLTMPYSRFYNSGFSETWLKTNYYDRINSIIETHNIPYFDYSQDERISNRDPLFSNSDHLNMTGRLLFSNILFEDLKTLQVFIEE